MSLHVASGRDAEGQEGGKEEQEDVGDDDLHQGVIASGVQLSDILRGGEEGERW